MLLLTSTTTHMDNGARAPVPSLEEIVQTSSSLRLSVAGVIVCLLLVRFKESLVSVFISWMLVSACKSSLKMKSS